MRREVLALLVSMPIAIGTGPLLAAEPVTSGDATARFVGIGQSKSVVIDFPRDLKEVVVADPSIVQAVALEVRRVVRAR